MATVTITTSGADDSRIAAAVGRYLGLPGNANASQVKQLIIDHLTTLVHDQERQVAIAAAIPPTDITPS